MRIKSLENFEINDTNFVNLRNILLQSINDWPTEVLTTEDYILEIEKKIGAIPNKQNIKNWINEVDVTSQSWHVESLGNLLEIYNFFDSSLAINEIVLLIPFLE